MNRARADGASDGEARGAKASPWNSRSTREGFLVGAIYSLLSGMMLVITARGQFDWFDMSAFLDAGYRTWRGQEPYVDFFYLGQPLHLWMHAFFFEILGFNQNAILAHLLTVNTAAVLVMSVFAWRRLGRGPAFLVITLFSLSFYGPIAHPWYDQNAYFFVLLGLWVLDGARAGDKFPRLSAFAAGTAASAAFMCKANVGLAGGGILALAATCSAGYLLNPSADIAAAVKTGLRTFSGLAAGLIPFAAGLTAGVAACLFALDSPGEFIYQAFVAYDSRSRLLNFEVIQNILLMLPFSWIILVGFLLHQALDPENRRKASWDVLLLSLICLTGIATAYSGSITLRGKNTFVAPAPLYLFRLAERQPWEQRARELVEALIGAGAVFLIVQAGYVAFPPIAWTWRGSHWENTYFLEVDALRGWKSDPSTGAGVDRVVRWIRREIPPEDDILVFPDCTVIYGLAGRESFRGAPFIWHYRHIPPPGPIYDKVRARIHRAPPLWFVLHLQHDVYFFETESMLRWMGFDSLLAERYEKRYQEGSFLVFRLKNSSESALSPTSSGSN